MANLFWTLTEVHTTLISYRDLVVMPAPQGLITLQMKTPDTSYLLHLTFWGIGGDRLFLKINLDSLTCDATSDFQVRFCTLSVSTPTPSQQKQRAI